MEPTTQIHVYGRDHVARAYVAIRNDEEMTIFGALFVPESIAVTSWHHPGSGDGGDLQATLKLRQVWRPKAAEPLPEVFHPHPERAEAHEQAAMQAHAPVRLAGQPKPHQHTASVAPLSYARGGYVEDRGPYLVGDPRPAAWDELGVVLPVLIAASSDASSLDKECSRAAVSVASGGGAFDGAGASVADWSAPVDSSPTIDTTPSSSDPA